MLSAVSLAASVSIGAMRADDVPWVRIGVVAGGLALCCGLAAVFRAGGGARVTLPG
ncbi:hypothetical protein [Plantactinospora sp. DSM 117369]